MSNYSSNDPCPNCGKTHGSKYKCDNCGTLGCNNHSCVGSNPSGSYCIICKKTTEKTKI